VAPNATHPLPSVETLKEQKEKDTTQRGTPKTCMQQ